MNFEKIMSGLRPDKPKTIAVAAADDPVVLRAVMEARRRGLAEAVLCGGKDDLTRTADRERLDISAFEIVDEPDPIKAAALAVSLVRQGKADILMKGLLQTADLLRAVLDKEHGLRGRGLLSHVGIINSPILDRTVIVTDAAMVPYPDLKAKAALIDNAVPVARALGMDVPKVAVLAAVEVVNPDMPATLDAAALAMMNRRGQIKNCLVDGPLAMDLALSEESARHKGLTSEVAGRADILLFHNIEAANATLKTFVFGGRAMLGGLIVGAAAPIVLTSRADSDQSKLYSIACAVSLVKGGLS